MFSESCEPRVIGRVALLLGAVAWLPGVIHADDAPKPAVDERAKSLTSTAQRLFNPLVEHRWAQGIVVGVFDERGSHVFGYGRKGAKTSDPPDGDTLFEIGSVTKVFTGILLADMVERGELRLEDPVNQLLPDEIPKLPCGEREMRLVDLATHSSGLPRMPANFKPKDDADPYADYTAEMLHECLKEHAKPSLARSLGKLFGAKSKQKWEYSNLGVGLLGHALARKAGCSYEDLVRDRISAPLEMNSTRLKHDESLAARLIPGHDWDGNPTKNWQFDCLAPCGGLRSTANDLLKFVAANLELRETPLKAALAKAREPHYTINAKVAMGLNWFLIKPDLVYHSGMTGAYTSFVAFCPPKKMGVVALADTTVGGELFEQVGFAFLKELTEGKPVDLPKIRVTSIVEEPILEKYVGKYRVLPLATITITHEKDRLYAQLTGQDRYRIYPESDNKFFCKVVDAQITFESNESGKVVRLVVDQNGQKTPAQRKPDVPAK